jgi:MFS family permease
MKSEQTGLRVSVIEGLFAQFHITLTGGMFLTAFALYLGANSFQMGVLVAIPSLLAGVGFFAAYLASLIGKRKILCVLTSVFGRGLFVAFIIPLAFRFRISIQFFFAVIFIFNLLLNFAGTLWMSWMSELVPRTERGRFFGLRNTLISTLGMIVNYIGGRLLDRLQQPVAFLIIFSISIFFSTLAGITLSRQPEPVFEKKTIPLKEIFLNPLRDRDFRKLVSFVSFWYLFAGMSAPFFVVHMIRNLKMTFSTIAVYSIIAGLSSLIFQLFWGRMIDRTKSKPILTINFLGMTVLPLFWLFAKVGFVLPIWFDAFFSGIFWSGLNLSLFSILLSLTEDKEAKESYFAVFSTITGLCGFLSSLMGGWLAQIMSNFKFFVFSYKFINFHVLFFSTFFFRLMSLFLLRRVTEKEAYPARYALQLIGDYTVRRLNESKDLVLNVIRFWK